MKSTLASAACFIAIYTTSAIAQQNDAELVQQVVQSAYVDGFANLTNIPAFEKSFHPTFEMLWLKDQQVEKTTIAQWSEGVKRRVARAGTKPSVLFTSKFVLIDVTGAVAVAKLELYEADKLSYTDYLSLYKFADGWKIVSKVGHSHT